MTNNEKFSTWWINGNEEREIDPDRAIILQAMRGDDIAIDVGPFVIQFDNGEDRDRFYLSDGMSKLVQSLRSQHDGVDFQPINDVPESDDGEEF